MKRLSLILLILFAPAVALADDSALQVTGSGVSSSNGVGTTLQPSSTENLQSTGSTDPNNTTQDASGLTAPNSSNLQPSSDAEVVKNYLNGELVGGPQGTGARPQDATSSSASLLDWIATIILLIVVGASGAVYASRRRRLAEAAILREMPAETKVESMPLSSEMATVVEENSEADTAANDAPVVVRSPVKGAGRKAPARKGKAKSKSGKRKARKR